MVYQWFDGAIPISNEARKPPTPLGSETLAHRARPCSAIANKRRHAWPESGSMLLGTIKRSLLPFTTRPYVPILLLNIELSNDLDLEALFWLLLFPR